MSQQDPTGNEAMASEFWTGEMSVDDIAGITATTTLEAGAEGPTDTESASTANPAASMTENDISAAQIAGKPLIPIPFPIARRAVSGRYRGTLGAFQLELRVDVDRTRPMNRISADFYQISGGTTSYFGSLVVNSPTIKVTATQVVIKGLGSFTFSAGNPVIQVSIQRRSIFQSQAPAALQFFSSAGAPGAIYNCLFESTCFRTVKIETDRVSDVSTPVFSVYNTALLPSGGSARNLSVVGAYAEAGIEMLPTPASDVINIAEGGPNQKWSNAELHASMQTHFSLWQDNPQWAVWQVAAQLHDMGPGLYGIMFDQQGKQRQGCAVFHQGIGGTTPEKLRLQLYTYVHELGHGFNLLHSWQKSLGSPAVPNRPLSLSWMNYPFNYPAPGGEATYWSQFAFQFDNEEIIHLRHAFRNNIIMGANNFAVGSALGREIMSDPVRNESGLSFTISTHQRKFALGEPVVLQLMLGTSDSRGRRVHTWLHPNCNLVKVMISKPGGTVVAYEPLIDHLVGARETVIGRDDVVRDSAYIGYGKDGLYFDQPGNYQIRASYTALDGSEILSDILTIRVSYPVTAAEEDLADLFMGEEQGTLLYLLGSDDDSLRNGNAAFDQVLAKYPKHPMASYVRLLKGMNASRDFKTISDDNQKRVTIRPAQIGESAELLSAVSSSGVLDPVTTQMTLSTLAEVHTKGGNKDAAKETLNKLSAIAISQPMPGRKKDKKQPSPSATGSFSDPSYWSGMRQ
ncbi:hypothetical protein BH11PSE12_BH11PSE12_28300 [soil metagenome]